VHADVALDDFDLVVEGEGRQVTDPETVAKIAERSVAGGWAAASTTAMWP
jgi:hypothetical protein